MTDIFIPLATCQLRNHTVSTSRSSGWVYEHDPGGAARVSHVFWLSSLFGEGGTSNFPACRRR